MSTATLDISILSASDFDFTEKTSPLRKRKIPFSPNNLNSLDDEDATKNSW